MNLTDDEVKACCATAYSSEAARFLLGDRFHPGGAALTSRLLRGLGVGPGQRIVDVASGPGTSAIQATAETGCAVVGVDLSSESVAAATAAARAAGLDHQVRFVVGDAEALPIEDAFMDGVLCECALCTFPNKAAATRELARVVRPGGRVAISDLTARLDRLPPELEGLGAWIACIADARPLEEVADLLSSTGLRILSTERHDEALGEMIDRVEARLQLAKMMGRTLDGLGAQVGGALDIARAARAAVRSGDLGYGVVIAHKP